MLKEPKLSGLDLAEGLHLAYAASALQGKGVLEELRSARTLQEICSRFAVDAFLLQAALDYLAARTDLVVAENGLYRTTKTYDVGVQAAIDLYVGAYAGNSASLPDLLLDPSPAYGLVDRSRHALAFDRLPGPGVAVLPSVLQELQLNHILDLGCGPGALLVEMGQHNSDFVGWGLDASPSACEAARTRISSAGLADRITIFQGNCSAADKSIPSDIRERVRVLTAASLLNGFFQPGTEAVIALLRYLTRVFPNRLLISADYYGALGRSEAGGNRRTLLQDFVQAISGQGIPPADDSAWKEIYSAAGCKFLHAFQMQSGEGFLHLLQLSPE